MHSHSLGLLQSSYWQPWMSCSIFSFLCPEYSCSSEVHLSRQASSAWVVMKGGLGVCRALKFAVPSVMHWPLHAFACHSSLTAAALFSLAVAAAPLSPHCQPTFDNTHFCQLFSEPFGSSHVWWTPCRLENEKFQGSSLIPLGSVFTAASSNPRAECAFRPLARAPGALEQPLKQIRVSRHECILGKNHHLQTLTRTSECYLIQVSHHDNKSNKLYL